MSKRLSSNSTLSHYRVVSKLGEGGMGEVFLAEDTRLRRRVALKVLPQSVAADADRLLRFEREAFAASALNHPNILTIFEFGVEVSTHFLAAEFVDGESLRERMNRFAMTLTETLEIVIQIASALQAAHDAGIIHRDIKPDNVMIRVDGYVKVLDFGLAKLAERPAMAGASDSSEEATRRQLQTQAGIVMGTVAYMSPEQARGHEVDKRTDIWSLGCVLYEMLTRQQPFRGGTTVDVLANIIHREPVPLVTLRQDANAELERIVTRTLRKNTSERYQTASELLVDLKHLQKRLEFEAELERTSSANRTVELKTQVIRPQTTGPTEALDSIAILPFSNLSADSNNEYFCDGLAEELLSALAKIDHLKVAARTSAFSFKGKNVNVSEIGQKLSVKTVLEGSVRRSGDRLRITVQLVNSSDGYQLWSERYDREMQDIFDVQDEITLAIVDALKLKLFSDEKTALLKRYTDNTEAYQLYLQGRYCYNKYTPEYFQKGIEYFEKAIELEPQYAPAYAGLGFCYGSLFYFSSAPPHEIIPKWRALIDQALKIDGQLVDAYLSRASIEFYYDWDFEKAELDYQRAIAINPNSPDAHWRYGHFLANCERFDEAISQGERAVELDPLSLVVQFFMARIYLLARRFDQGFEQLRRMQGLEPNFAGGLTQLGGLYLVTHKYDEAIEAYKKALTLGHFIVPALSYLGAAYGLAGKRDDAYQTLDQLLELEQTRYVSPFSVARVYSALGETDKAFEWFERAFEERSGEMVALKSEVLAGLMGNRIIRDDRFKDLVRRVGMRVDLPSLNKTTSEAEESPTAILLPGVSSVPGAVATGSTTDHSIAPTITPEAPDKTKTKLFVASLILVSLIAIVFGYRYFFSNTQINSIAVMPFVNGSTNADIEYLSDGMAETLINSLSQLPQLSVKARSSVFRYKGKEVDPQTVGNELNVQAILNGRVVERGDDLTLYLSLVDTRTGNQLWGEQYNRKQTDLLSLQTEVGRDVATKLRTRLSGAEEQKVAKNYTQNAEAYQLYLQGRYFSNKRTPETIQKAIGYFQQAIEKDPNYALGYAGLSDAYALLAYYRGAPAQEALPKAREAARKALSLDSNLPEARNAFGFVLVLYDYDYAGAEREYRRVIELNPNYALAHQNLGVMLNRIGRHEEGMAELRRALELEPLSIVINRLYGDILLCSKRYDEAMTQLKKTLELDPTFPTTYLSLSSLYQLTGKYAESVESYAKYLDLSAGSAAAKLARDSFAAGGWQGYLRQMTGPDRPAGVSPFMAATFFVQLGERDKAFAELDKAFDNREALLLYIKIDPRLDPLRDDSRFQALIRRMRFPE